MSLDHRCYAYTNIMLEYRRISPCLLDKTLQHRSIFPCQPGQEEETVDHVLGLCSDCKQDECYKYKMQQHNETKDVFILKLYKIGNNHENRF